MVDSSPPVHGKVTVSNFNTKLKEDHDLLINWDGIKDKESGIASYEFGIGSLPFAADVVPFMHASSSVTYFNGKDQLIDGNKYYFLVKVILFYWHRMIKLHHNWKQHGLAQFPFRQ